MMIDTQRWLRLAFALTLLSGAGCAADGASPDADDSDEEGSVEPSTDDDGDDDGVSDGDAASEEDGETPAIDAGGNRSDSGARPTPSGAKDSGGGGAADAGSASRADASSAGSNNDGGGAANTGDSSVSPGTGAGAGSCGPENTVSAAELGDTKKLGPWKPMHVERTGPSGSSWVYYPEGIGKDGLKHPVFQWGPGAGTGPDRYLDHLNLLASHGFVVVSQSSTQSGKGALDWILKQNETQGSMWFGKLDTNRVARGGHSMGALQSMSEAADPRLKMTVLVCGGASGGGGADKITYPSIFLGGVGESGTRNFAGDYAEVKGLSVFVTHSMTDHVACARDNMGPWVAFMRWHLCGEEAKWKKEFMAGGTYCKSPWQACMGKML
jgi:hypothetical protein